MKEQYIRKDSGLYLYPEVEEPKYLYPGDISSVVKYSREQKAYNKWKESRIEMSPELKAVTKEGDVLTEGKDFVIIGGQRKRNHDGSTTRTEKLAIIITKEAGEDYVASVPPQDETFVASHTASSGNPIEQLVTFIKELKSDAMDGYVKNEDVELKTMYSAQNMICGMILSKVNELFPNNQSKKDNKQ